MAQESWEIQLDRVLHGLPVDVKATDVQHRVRDFFTQRKEIDPFCPSELCILCHPDLSPRRKIDVDRFLRAITGGHAIPYAMSTIETIMCQACFVQYDIKTLYDQYQSAKEEEAKERARRQTAYRAEKERRDNNDFQTLTGRPTKNFWRLVGLMKPADVKTLKSMPYREFLQTLYWKTIRRYLIHKRGGCELCSYKSQAPLNIHHRTYAHRGEEYCHLEDLIVLCEPCHAKFHDKLPQHAEGED